MPYIDNYIVLKNVDKSIELLNPLLTAHNLEFIVADKKMILNEYLDFFNSLEQKKNRTPDEIISEIRMGPLGRDLLLYGNIVFLKQKESIYLDQIENFGNGHIKLMSYLVDLHKKENEWITKLRLIGKGDVGSFADFQMVKENMQCINQQHILNPLPFGELYQTNENSIYYATQLFEKDIFSKEYIRNSLTYFNLTYTFTDYKAKFLNLMICLECLFNLGKDQISHTISRHIAIILSINKDEFIEYYKKCKKLYSLRSDIVHGQKIVKDNDVKENLEILYNYVRRILIYFIINNEEKQIMFEKFNYMGFTDTPI